MKGKAFLELTDDQQMKLMEVTELAMDLMEDYSLTEQGWSFKFDKTTNTYGMCRYRLKQITLSKFRVLSNTIERTKEVILHEIAHALCPVGAKHGPVWKQQMISMGQRPERCFSDHDPVATRTKRPFKGECPSCHKIIYVRSRRKKSCGTCYPHFYNPKYQFIWSINS
jgi:predicted SprT family Zn-dependent metalloprotease